MTGRTGRNGTALAWLALALLLPGDAARAARAGEELGYPAKAFAKLDTFEALNLEEADKLYHKKDYQGAYAAYKAYSFEFAKSPALAYVLLRMGRCLHKLGKRNGAIKAYQDVVDYFPDDVRYAAAALYHIGECHGQNGDDDKKTATWARMVKDDGYVAQPNSGTALTYLGRRMAQLDKHGEAVTYHWRTAVAFRTSNPRAAEDARNSVIFHYVCRAPNHDKLKQFYVEAGGFDGRGRKTDTPEDDTRYWRTVIDRAQQFRAGQEKKEEVSTYWSGRMGDRFAGDDDLRKRWFELLLVHEKEPRKWVERMDRQYASKPASLARLMQWCNYYSRDPKLRAAFFEKQAPAVTAGLQFQEQLSLVDRLHRMRMDREAQAALRAVNTRDLKDEQLWAYAGQAARYRSEEEIMRILARIKDKEFATKCRFDYYNGRSHRNRPFQEKALAEIPALKKIPKYAGAGLVWREAELLRSLGRYEEAIKAYRAANRQPDSTWAVTDCLVAMKQYGQAIKTVQGLESVGGAVASKACMRVADIYRSAGDKAKEVDQLRLVLRRYPKSGESSQAHQRLENYGVKILGGEARAEE